MASSSLPSFQHYKLDRELGFGRFGRVYACERDAEHPRASGLGGGLAVKVFDLSKIPRREEVVQTRKQNMRREVENWKKLPRHQNIVHFVEFVHTDDWRWAGVVMERVCGEDLLRTIIKHNIEPYQNELPAYLVFLPFSEAQTRFVVKQVINGVEFLHSHGVIHRDLKLENIFVDETTGGDRPDLWHVKIGDLGLSKDVGRGEGEAGTNCGTETYAAPEVLCRDEAYNAYTFKADVWSVGIILFVLLAGRFPFQSDYRTPMVELKKAAKATSAELWEEIFRPEFGSSEFGVSQDARNILLQMLQKSDEERLSVAGVKNHLWFSSSVPLTTCSSSSASSTRRQARAAREASRCRRGGQGRPAGSHGLRVFEASIRIIRFIDKRSRR